MTNKGMAEQTRKGMEAFKKLPLEEQIRIMMEAGTINEKGEVLFGQEAKDQVDRLKREKDEKT